MEESLNILQRSVGVLSTKCRTSLTKDGPNVKSNLLPEHGNSTINSIEYEQCRSESSMVSNERVVESQEESFFDLIIRVEEGSHQDVSDVVESTKIPTTREDGHPFPKPLIIHYNLASQAKTPLVIPVPEAQYKDRRYNEGEIIPDKKERTKTAEDITNIARIGRVTRSRRVYTPNELWKKDIPQDKKKGRNRREATEFLKLIRHTKYEMLDQLNKTQARISLLSLLVNSEGHHQLLLKILNEAHITKDISVEMFGGIVNNIAAAIISLFQKRRRDHNKTLHIAVKCGDYIIARVLVDNGSSLNEMPKATLDKLLFIGARLQTRPIVARAFDGSKREVMGENTLPIYIGPKTKEILRCFVTYHVPSLQPLNLQQHPRRQ
ncbi:hypothetical protein CR513_32987, partial [Mucuna pruriens]